MAFDDELLKERYEEIAHSGDVRTTACDHQLRELEIEFGLEHIRDATISSMSAAGLDAALNARS